MWFFRLGFGKADRPHVHNVISKELRLNDALLNLIDYKAIKGNQFRILSVKELSCVQKYEVVQNFKILGINCIEDRIDIHKAKQAEKASMELYGVGNNE